MPNKYRSEAGTRVDYVKAEKPKFDLLKEAGLDKPKPYSGPREIESKAPKPTPPKHPVTGKFMKRGIGSMATAPHGKDIRDADDKLEE